jgi:dinuclear metal center YbgI/SA1388 family protein
MGLPKRRPVLLKSVVAYCDRMLQIDQFNDWPGAVNGLQLENGGLVTKIVAAVDASLMAARRAVEAEADLLVVHHGLFWGESRPWTGGRYELMRLLCENKVAVYSAHLPLDAHPKLGNNALLCAALGFKRLTPFFTEKGRALGLQTSTDIALADLTSNLAQVIGATPVVLACGPERCRRIGVVTGSAGAELSLAVSEGVDTFITGEGPHWSYALAQELGVNVLYGGHYATETFGVKALAAHLAARYDVPWAFIDDPSGL